jgi:ABC-type lipoprotein release transport system permease subunit
MQLIDELRKRFLNTVLTYMIITKRKWVVLMKEEFEDTVNVVFACTLIGILIGVWFLIIPA